MTDFQKTRYCPTSEMLAMYAEDGIEVIDVFVERHLGICDFCRAEVEFYRWYPPVEATISDPGPVPHPLFELAEALLDARSNMRAFYRLVGG